MDELSICPSDFRHTLFIDGVGPRLCAVVERDGRKQFLLGWDERLLTAQSGRFQGDQLLFRNVTDPHADPEAAEPNAHERTWLLIDVAVAL